MTEFLSPVSNAVLAHKEVLPEGSLGKHIFCHTTSGMPEVKAHGFAIVAVSENRNDINYMGEEVELDGYRKAFYSLYPGNWKRPIFDLGTIAKGDSVSDTYFAVQTVLRELLENDVIPIVLGGSQDIGYAQYRAYDTLGKMVNVVNVDSLFDVGDAEKPINNKSYVGKIIVDKPYNLFNYSVLGYQSYLNPPAEIALMEKLYFDPYRLGEITADITYSETIFRDADLAFFDVAAIKRSEYSYKHNSPNGLDGREICALSRYAGISNRISSFGIYELKPFEVVPNGPDMVAQILWYFMEGVAFRVADEDFENEQAYTIYKVPIDDQVLTFKKSKKTGRWWIELPFISNVDNKLKRHTLLPCTYGEYLSATEGEIPERWLKARRKNEV
ncbi:formimidoylglutamase [Flavobacteriaceae bacterium TK19130]|nr:formimidoylglutamase [Thermobacterium salinum]